MLKVHNEPMHTQSPFLTHFKSLDVFKRSSMSANTSEFRLSYLRVEIIRLRAGMSDYLIRVSTPLLAANGGSKSNTVLTLRADRTHGTLKGAQKVATVIAAEMLKREDTTHLWEGVNNMHLTKMLLPYLKFFTANTFLEQMQFTTEALL